ncbi:MAG TPA: hypothetical protein VLE69_01095 [Candidatus Saccharimonadales bacterium]|nr:hypothetical protein [Candidatus Saccharimonadales bacterium]
MTEPGPLGVVETTDVERNPGELLVSAYQEVERISGFRGKLNGIIKGLESDLEEGVSFENELFAYWGDATPELQVAWSELLGINDLIPKSKLELSEATINELGRGALNLVAAKNLLSNTVRLENGLWAQQKELLRGMRGKNVKIEAVEGSRDPICTTGSGWSKEKYPSVVEGEFRGGQVSAGALFANFDRSRFMFKTFTSYNIEVTAGGVPQVDITVLD